MKSLYTLVNAIFVVYRSGSLPSHMKKKMQDYLNHLSILISTYNLLYSEKAYNWEGEDFQDGISCKIFREIYQIIKFEHGS
jgi:hypothetical protein